MGKRPKSTKSEHERKQLAHVRNFAPRHYSWQSSFGKQKNLRRKKSPNSLTKFFRQAIIPCLVCGGTSQKKRLGYRCLNCGNLLSNKEIVANFPRQKPA